MPSGHPGIYTSLTDVTGEKADRAELNRAIARENGPRIIADPSLALDVLARQ